MFKKIVAYLQEEGNWGVEKETKKRDVIVGEGGIRVDLGYYGFNKN